MTNERYTRLASRARTIRQVRLGPIGGVSPSVGAGLGVSKGVSGHIGVSAVQQPEGLYIPVFQGPILKHNGNPTVRGSIYHGDGGTYNYSNQLINGTVRAAGGSTINIYDSEINGQGASYCCAGWGGTINLYRTEVWNALDCLKDRVNTEQCTLHKLYYAPGTHGDCVQLQNSGSVATHKWSYLNARYWNRPGPNWYDDLANASFIIKNDLGDGTQQQILIEDCWFDGGNYCVYFKAGDADNGGPAPSSSIVRRSYYGGFSRYGQKTGGAGWDWRYDDLSTLVQSLDADSPNPHEWDVTLTATGRS